jgi:hypothetical protein
LRWGWIATLLLCVLGPSSCVGQPLTFVGGSSCVGRESWLWALVNIPSSTQQSTLFTMPRDSNISSHVCLSGADDRTPPQKVPSTGQAGTYDVCGVCGGNGSSCASCNSSYLGFSPADLDAAVLCAVDAALDAQLAAGIKQMNSFIDALSKQDCASSATRGFDNWLQFVRNFCQVASPLFPSLLHPSK